jgi:hypothetical protein
MAIGNTLINSSDRNVGMEVCLKTWELWLQGHHNYCGWSILGFIGCMDLMARCVQNNKPIFQWKEATLLLSDVPYIIWWRLVGQIPLDTVTPEKWRQVTCEPWSELYLNTLITNCMGIVATG